MAGWILEVNDMKYFLGLLLALHGAGAFACQGEFVPIAGSGSPFTQVHLCPKDGNRIEIGGGWYTIPAGVCVISGGLIGTYNDATIGGVSGQSLAAFPLTVFYVYAEMAGGVMTMDFETTGHIEGRYGNEVNVSNPALSLIGMIRTDASGKFVGSAMSQMTLGWCPCCRIGLQASFTGQSTSSPTLVVPAGSPKLEWLQWGINASFLQASRPPNLHLDAVVGNSAGPGKGIQASILLDGSAQVGIDGTQIWNAGEARGLHVFWLGANGTNEGYHYAQPLLSNGGSSGTVNFGAGVFHVDPLDS
jgi:hypothetical protein